MDKILERVKDLVKECPYYQKESYLNANSLKQMPVISRYDIVNNYEQFLCPQKPLVYTYTSGSSGIPLKIAWNYNEYLKSIMTLWRLRSSHGIFTTDFCLTCHCEIDTHGKRIDNPIIVLPNSLSLSKICYSENILQEYIRMIDLFRPKWILAQPSFVYLIARYIKEHKPELLLAFKYVELIGEMLTQTIKSQIVEMFPNASVVNMYGLQEFNGILYENDNILKVVNENVFVEIINEYGNDCMLNEEGDIVVTGLQNSAFPLIRYNTKDRGKRVSLNGVDGFEITVGRSNDQFIWDGKLYDGSLFFTAIEEYAKQHNANIRQFQVVYDNDVFEVHLWGTDFPSNDVGIGNDLQNVLKALIGYSLPIIVCIASSNSEFIQSGRKIKYFINKQKRK